MRDSKYLKLLKYLERLILQILELLDNYCTLMVYDIDTIYPTIIFKEELKQTKNLIGCWFNWDKPKKSYCNRERLKCNGILYYKLSLKCYKSSPLLVPRLQHMGKHIPLSLLTP